MSSPVHPIPMHSLHAPRRPLADAPARYNFPAEHLADFRAFLDGFSVWMVNTAPESGA